MPLTKSNAQFDFAQAQRFARPKQTKYSIIFFSFFASYVAGEQHL